MVVLMGLSIWDEKDKIMGNKEEGYDIPMSFICCGNDYTVHVSAEEAGQVDPNAVRMAAEHAHAMESPGCLSERP